MKVKSKAIRWWRVLINKWTFCLGIIGILLYSLSIATENVREAAARSQ